MTNTATFNTHYRVRLVDLHLHLWFTIPMDDNLHYKLWECATLGNI